MIKYKDFLKYEEFLQAVAEALKDKDRSRSVQQYILSFLIEEIDGIQIEGNYSRVFELLDFEYLENLAINYLERRVSYHSSLPEVNSLNELPSVVLTLPISKEKVTPSYIEYSPELWNLLLLEKQILDTLGSLSVSGEILLISLWIPGGIIKVLSMPEEDVLYLEAFLLQIMEKFHLEWTLSPSQLEALR